LSASTKTSTTFSATDLTAGYATGRPIIRDISIAVESGKVVAIIGPNGAGKSTLLKSLLGSVQIFSGHVHLDATELTGLPPDELARRGVGYVPQIGDTFPALTVRENLEMGGYLLPRKLIAERIQSIVDTFPALAPMMQRRADHLSGGERKMLAVGRGMMLGPSVMLLDEPTASLSPQLAEELLSVHVRRLADSGTAVLLVEQRARAALSIADWAYVLASGQLILAGEPSELLTRPGFSDLYLGGATSIGNADRTPLRSIYE
jgi:ABC-type branched-subunit amino acid transport system ATPase component